MTKFSIIIPTFNSGIKIQRAVNSVLNQGVDDWELIIINDGSTDNTEEYILPFLEDERIKYHNMKNAGVSEARNVGIKNSKAKYIIFLDADDSIKPNLLLEILKIDYKRYDVITWSVERILNNEIHIIKPIKQSGLYKHKTTNFLAGSVCYRKEIVEQVGMYDSNLTFGENYELGLRICQLPNLQIKLIPEVLSTYFQGTKQRASNTITKQLTSLIYSYKKHKELYENSKSEKFTMLNLLGYLLEKYGNRKLAKKFYISAWCINPWNIKPLLRFLFPANYLNKLKN
jgi:glycosyltransferase involved in cell wall biosynthesis